MAGMKRSSWMKKVVVKKKTGSDRGCIVTEDITEKGSETGCDSSLQIQETFEKEVGHCNGL